MRQATAILLASGRGSRFSSKTPKSLAKIKSQPIIAYSLKALNSHPWVKAIIVVVNNSNRAAVARLVREKKIGKVESLVEGGRRRQDSVRRALKGLDSAAGLVLIHDAARPFISRDEISRVIRQAAKSGAAILAVPVKATIKKIRPSPGKRRGKSRYYVEGTLRRDTLVEVQTPQVFDKEIILKAYRRFGAATVTDDASLVEKSGREVSIVRGCYHNIKITTPEDLLIAEAIAGRINSKSQIPNPK